MKSFPVCKLVIQPPGNSKVKTTNHGLERAINTGSFIFGVKIVLTSFEECCQLLRKRKYFNTCKTKEIIAIEI